MYSNIQSYQKKITNKFLRQDGKRKTSISNLKKDNFSTNDDLHITINYDADEESNLIRNYNALKRSINFNSEPVTCPTQCLEFCTILRPIRTTRMCLLENTEKTSSKLEPYNASYNKDFIILKSKYEGCNKIHLQNQAVGDDSCFTDAPIYEVSVELDGVSTSGDVMDILEHQPFNSISTDPLITGLLNDLSSEAAVLQSVKLRQKCRQPKLFNLYSVPDSDKLIDFSSKPEFPKEIVGKSIKVQVKSFKLEFDVEPIFGILCLYDLKNRKKISENFYFDFNDMSKWKMMHEKYQLSPNKQFPLSDSCIFHVDNLSDVFLVIRIEKILQQGDVNDIADSYLKDDKHKSKLRPQIEWSCKNLSKYRMPFGLYAVELQKDLQNNTFQSSNSIDNCSVNSGTFSVKSSRLSTNLKHRSALESNSIRSASHSQSKDINLLAGNSLEDDDFGILPTNMKSSIKSLTYFFRQEPEKISDEDLYKWLQDFRKPGSNSKRMKPIPCQMDIEISYIDEMNSSDYILSPEEIPLATKYQLPRHSKQSNIDHLVMDTLEFPVDKRLAAHAIYRNLLYVYPKSVNFNNKQGSLRNIAIRVQFFVWDDDKPQLLKLIYNKSKGTKLTTEAFTKVLYHNKNPDFNDEIKIQLPGRVTVYHYLLFTFYHVSCQSNKKSDNSPFETLIGHSWLPLLENEILYASEHSLMVSTEKPLLKHILKKPDLQNSIEDIHWLENHKELFRVFIQPVSTVHSEDYRMEKFNNGASTIRYNLSSEDTDTDKNIMMENLDKLESWPLIGLIQFSSIVLDNLLWLTLRFNSPQNSFNQFHQYFLNMIATLVNRITNQSCNKNINLNRDSILATYVTYAACLPGLESEDEFWRCWNSYNKNEFSEKRINLKDPYLNPENYNIVTSLFHEDLLTLILQCIDAGSYEYMIDNLWFFLELLTRGMKEHYYYVSINRKPDQKQIFSNLFINKLWKLTKFSTQQIDRYMKDFITSEDLSVRSPCQQKCQNLIRNLAIFYNNLLTLLHPDIIKYMIIDFMELINCRIHSEKKDIDRLLVSLKLEFLRIMSDTEYFLNLNEFEKCPSSTTIHTVITDVYIVPHFFLALILTEVKLCLKSCDLSLQSSAVHIIWNIIASHESDSRYTDPVFKSNIASLYLPFINILFEVIKSVLPQKSGSSDICNQSISNDFCSSSISEYRISQNNSIMIESMEEDTDNINPMNTLETEGNSYITENSRHLLLCFVWILKNVDNQTLTSWLKTLPIFKINKLLHLMILAIVNFEFKAYKDIRSKSMVDSCKSSLTDLHNIDFKRQTSTSSRRMFQETSLSIMEGKLCAEVIFIILDSLNIIIRVFETSQQSNSIIICIFKMIIRSIQLNQSVVAVQSILAFLRPLLKKHYKLLFDEAIYLCGDLCKALLKLSGSNLKEIRSHSVASLYMLMRYNFQLDNTFARIKLQITMALSKLVWDREDSHQKRLIELSLNSSLRTIVAYTDVEMELHNCHTMSTEDSLDYSFFANQVQELVLNLHSILTDTVKMHQFEEDTEMQIDLMSRIAKGYQNSPDLRLSWLQRMHEKHKKVNKAEAGMCLAHCAAIVAEYLGMKEPLPYMPVGCVQLAEALGPNLLEESAISDDVVSPDEDGVCCDDLFSQRGFMKLIKNAAKYFTEAGMFELIPRMYRIVLPILEEHEDFSNLSKFHTEIKNAYDSIQTNVDKRIFATYFRIGFYGEGFKDLNNQEYICKEPPFTKLPEISTRIETFYSARFGKDKVNIIKDSNIVKVETLEKNKMYIQITFVEPYFEMSELRRRKNVFEKNYNLKNFVFSTPYTLEGKAHGELKDQYKRKTILTTEKAFPYLKTRIRVIRKYQIDLTPIEVALEDLSRKVEQLSWVLSKNPIDAKYLQMMLQGSIGTTVNQGPLELATSFLSTKDITNGAHYNKLRLCFKEFLHRCAEGIEKNQHLISSDQHEYQKELEKNFIEISKQLNPLLNIHCR